MDTSAVDILHRRISVLEREIAEIKANQSRTREIQAEGGRADCRHLGLAELVRTNCLFGLSDDGFGELSAEDNARYRQRTDEHCQ